MDDKTIEALARDIEDLKRAVRRNEPLLNEVFDLKGWFVYSLVAGFMISAFALPLHVLLSAYGSFARIPAPWRAGLWAVVAAFLVGLGAVKLAMVARGGGHGWSAARLWKVMRSFYGGASLHVNLPSIILLATTVPLAFAAGHPWYGLSGFAMVIGVWWNMVVLQTGVRAYLALGYWSFVSGFLSLFWIETAPFLWVFAICAGMMFAFAAAVRYVQARKPGDEKPREEKPREEKKGAP